VRQPNAPPQAPAVPSAARGWLWIAAIVFAVAVVAWNLAHANTEAPADDWKFLTKFGPVQWQVYPASVERAAHSGKPSIGVWVRQLPVPEYQLPSADYEIWVECTPRRSSTYNPRDRARSDWTVITPGTVDWAVWQFLCVSTKTK
jgi:hypothetical protein